MTSVWLELCKRSLHAGLAKGGRMWSCIPVIPGDWLTHRPHLASYSSGTTCQCLCGKYPRGGSLSTKCLWGTAMGGDYQGNLRGSRHSPCPSTYSFTHRLSNFASQVSNHSSHSSLCSTTRISRHIGSSLQICMLDLYGHTILKVVSCLAGEEKKPLRHGEINIQGSMIPTVTRFETKDGAEE